MSKLDELMEMADRFATDREAVGAMRARGQAGGSTPLMTQDSRTALQDALKAVVEDAERLDWLQSVVDKGRVEIAKSVFGSGYEIGEMPDMRATATVGTVRDVIDAARKP